MLRIGQPSQPPNVAPAQSNTPPPELMAALAGGEETPGPTHKTDKYSINKVSPDLVNYVGPDATCGNCEFFTNDSCHLVEGKIDATWHCNLFTPLGGRPDEPDEPSDEQSTETPEQTPTEPPQPQGA